MAYQPFNFGKRHGLASRGIENYTTGENGTEIIAIRDAPPVPNTPETGGTSYVDPWVRKQMEGFLAGLANQGDGEPRGGSGDPGVNLNPYSSGGSSTTGGDRNRSPGTIDPTQPDLKAIKYKQMRALLQQKTEAMPCDERYDPNCCSTEQIAQIVLGLMNMFDRLRENGFGNMADCLEYKILVDQSYRIRCPNDSPFYYSDIHFDDPNWEEFVRSPEDRGELIFPDVMLDIDDGLYSLMSIMGVCEPLSDEQYLRRNSMAAFIMLGKIPQCHQIREIIKKHLEERGISYGQLVEKGLVLGVIIDGQTFVYYPQTGKLSRRVNGQDSDYAQWPPFLCNE